jgi:hypothetical protein
MAFKFPMAIVQSGLVNVAKVHLALDCFLCCRYLSGFSKHRKQIGGTHTTISLEGHRQCTNILTTIIAGW